MSTDPKDARITELEAALAASNAERDSALVEAQWVAGTSNETIDKVWAAIGGHDPSREGGCNLEGRLKEFVAAREAAEAEAARLREALEPFANACGELFNDWCPDETPAWQDGDDPSPVTVGDFRKARAALGAGHD